MFLVQRLNSLAGNRVRSEYTTMLDATWQFSNAQHMKCMKNDIFVISSAHLLPSCGKILSLYGRRAHIMVVVNVNIKIPSTLFRCVRLMRTIFFHKVWEQVKSHEKLGNDNKETNNKSKCNIIMRMQRNCYQSEEWKWSDKFKFQLSLLHSLSHKFTLERHKSISFQLQAKQQGRLGSLTFEGN